MALGADWINAGRGFMFALGCIQSLTCHTNRCPAGVATQDPMRQRALVVPDKAERVYNFHRNTLAALADMIAAAGLEHPGQIGPHHLGPPGEPDRDQDVLAAAHLPRGRGIARRSAQSRLLQRRVAFGPGGQLRARRLMDRIARRRRLRTMEAGTFGCPFT